LALGICGSGVARAQEVAPSRLAGPIDERALVTLPGNVRRDLTADRDLGPVEDGLQLRLYLVLQRSPAQQADLDNLLARQQQPTAPEYHKWLTPQEFGARFGASPQDLATLSTWLEGHGFQVHGALNNLSMIDFSATAGQVRAAFHTQLRYYNIQGGRYLANAQDPQIPAALAPAVAGIAGLSKIPPGTHHTPIHRLSYDGQAHRWLDLGPASGEPRYYDGSGDYAVTPQDFYTIYNVNPLFTGGNLGAGATIGLPEPTDIQFGTVNSGTGAASGGDVATFRSLFGVPGTLNMTVLHGSGTVTCRDPGIVSGSEDEATLDAEWANAVAPSAHLVFMACDDTSVGNGFISALTALIDNNLSDAISSSYGNSEAVTTMSEFATDDTLASQAAAQGQSFLDAAGDAGSADADQNSRTTAVRGLNVDQYAGQPLITGVGGTDFADTYDAEEGGQPVSTYWAATNSQYYGDALSYIPETPWNSSCADSIIANQNGFTGAAYCASLGRTTDGTVVGGGGGFSAHYAQPSYQPGILGLSSTATKRAVPDVAFFAASGYWGHYLVLCDSTTSSSACTSPSTFGGAGGTSFTAPQFAGVTALLVTYIGERQGNLNPALYALAKAQYSASATATACYSNGQTNNIGVTTALPEAACIFNDITTGNNDQPCESGSPNCYVNTGSKYGMLSTTGASSLTVGYPAGVGYDEATGLGSVNITNLIHNWNTAFTSTTGVQASLTSISSAQSTKLTAMVTGGTPAGYDSAVPAVSGSAGFAAGTVALGNCILSGGSCALTVPGSALQAGANSVTATFSGSGTYPASTSGSVTVTVTGAASQTINFGTLPNRALGDLPFTVSASATSGLTVGFNSQTPATCTVSVATVTLVAVGTCTVQATQAGNTSYSPAPSVNQSFQVEARCDVTGDSAASVADVQLMINEALGVAPAVNDLNHDGVIDVVDVQRVIDAVLLLSCPN
jgi:subtilase family serine protease